MDFYKDRRIRKSPWPLPRAMGRLARPRRFERLTPSLGGKCSIQLSYGCSTLSLKQNRCHWYQSCVRKNEKIEKTRQNSDVLTKIQTNRTVSLFFRSLNRAKIERFLPTSVFGLMNPDRFSYFGNFHVSSPKPP